MTEDIGGRVSLMSLYHQEPLQQILCEPGKVLALLYLFQVCQFLLKGMLVVRGFVEKRMLSARQEHVHDDTECPDVYALGILVVLGDLWRHVHQGAHVLIVGGLRLVSEAKVDDLDRRVLQVDRVLIDQDVGRLQIPVNDPVVMNVLHCVNNALHYPGCFDVREPLALVRFPLDQIEQLTVANVLHTHIQLFSQLYEVLDLYNVVVVQLAEQLRLLLRQFHEDLLVLIVDLQYLCVKRKTRVNKDEKGKVVD